MLKVGLTGNIGSGKTLVCQIFESLGVSVFYADKVARELYDFPEIRTQVKEVFGDDVYDFDGKLIRPNLARLVFHDEQALRKINGIIHPGVVKEYLKWLDKHGDEDYTVHEAAILFESGLEHEFDHIIMVSAPEEVRLHRVMERDGVEEKDVKARMKNQWTEEKKIRKADFVIINDGKKFLIPQILKIHNQLKNRQLDIMEFEQITKQVIEISKRAGQIIREEVSGFSESDVEYKGSHDLVSYVDKKSEAFLVNELKKIVPEAGFIAEESPELKKAERYNWIIDPLDGTTNFVHKIPVFSVSIALAEYEKPVVGVIFEINLNECFYAWKDGPAFLNGKEIKVSDTDILDQSLIATGFPYYDYSRLDAYLVLFKELMQSSRGVRRLGSAAVDLAYVACGRFELFYEYGLNPWDVAAGALIVERAGGHITTFNEDDNFIFGKEIVASNAKIHDEFMTKVKTFFS